MPFDPVLTLETAVLLLICFLVGATAGSMLHIAVLRGRKPAASRPVVAAAPAAPVGEALVATPVIAPLSAPPRPTAPAEVPGLDFGLNAPVEARVAAAPARKAGTVTSGRDFGRPDRLVAAVATAAGDDGPVESVALPPPAIAPADGSAVEPPMPVAAALEAISGLPPEAGVAAAVSEPPAVEQPTTAVLDVTAELLAITPKEAPDESIVSDVDPDEFAAMRAIEGNWTPSRRHPKPVPEFTPEAAPEVRIEPVPEARAEPERATAETHPVPEPSMEAVPIVVVADDDDEARTPADDPVAEVPPIDPPDEDDRIVPADEEQADEVEPLAARVEPRIEPGIPEQQDQPQGIGAPRHGMRDDLTQIVGVLPVVETALNRIGVYHFDQVAEWTDGNAAWVETHLGIGGRVDREHWREQARELAMIAAGGRPSRRQRPH